MSISIFTMAISLFFVLMMIRNIETGFESTLDVYLTLNVASIVFVVSLPVIPITLLRYRTLYNEPPRSLTKEYTTGTWVKKRFTICHKHPVSKGYHLKHVHQLENVKKETILTDTPVGCSIILKQLFPSTKPNHQKYFTGVLN